MSIEKPTELYSQATKNLARLPRAVLDGGVKALDNIAEKKFLPGIIKGVANRGADKLQRASMHQRGYLGGE